MKEAILSDKAPAPIGPILKLYARETSFSSLAKFPSIRQRVR